MQKNMVQELMFHENSTKDAQLFVDFNLLKDSKEFNGEEAAVRFNDYMSSNIEQYEAGEKTEVTNNFSNFSEEVYFPRLGFGKTDNMNGRGTAAANFIDVLERLQKKDKLKSLTYGNIYATVFVQDYGPDKSSDTLITLITPELSKYTQKVAQAFGFPTMTKKVKYWNIEGHNWQKMDIILANTSGSDEEKDYLLVVPEEILTANLSYSMENFIFSYWREIMNNRLKVLGEPTLTKDKLVEHIKSYYESNYAYMLSVLTEMDSSQLQEYLERSKYRSLVKKNKRMGELRQE